MGGSRKQRRNKKRQREVDLGKLGEVVEAARERALNEAEHKVLQDCKELLTDLLVRVPRGNEKKDDVLGEDPEPESEGAPKVRKGGTGRKERSAFPGAKEVYADHPDLKPGDLCPCGCGYKLYALTRAAVSRHFEGQVPIKVTFCYRQQLKSAGCDSVYTAPLPEGLWPKPYHPTAISMFAMFRYAMGLPMYRSSMMLGYLGVPVAVSTQYEQVAEAANSVFKPVLQEMIDQAAQGEVSYVDDTTNKILKYQRPADDERTGIFTTGIISVQQAFEVVLYFTGRNHSGENMRDVLKRRKPDLPALIQMSDALSRNFSELTPGQVIDCVCLIHGRRNFVEIVDTFPQDCRYVLEALARVYQVDRKARDDLLDPTQRLHLHQTQPVMDNLKKWLDEQFEQKKVEPNSALGGAIAYMRNHWDKLTVFLRVAGAPLDNNAVERALKRVVLHRKNSLFFRTAKGAVVGDLYMSLIQTCQRNNVDPFDYLTQVQLHADAAAARPGAWLPWTYKATLATMAEASTTVGAAA